MARARGWCWGPTTRPPAGGVGAGRGRPRRTPPSWCRSWSARRPRPSTWSRRRWPWPRRRRSNPWWASLPGVKWPNDLVVGRRKLAGILAEASWPPGADIASGWTAPGERTRVPVVVGMGLNVRAAGRAPDLRVRGHRLRRARRCARHPGGAGGRLAGGPRPLVRPRRRPGRPHRRSGPSGGAGRPRSASGSGSTWAPTTSRARPSTSPPVASSSSAPSRARPAPSPSATSPTSARL